MSKRDLAAIASNHIEVDTPRTKRRRGPSPPPTSQNGGPTALTSTQLEHKAYSGEREEDKMDQEEVKALGRALWQTIKDAVNKEGRVLSELFQRLPSKRLYPDYYDIIKKPISLELILENLEAGGYLTLAAVKEDLEQCFVNAKKYNQRDSPIWKDAKSLHKLVKKEYAKVTGLGEEDINDQLDGADHAADVSDDESKKKKAHSLPRLLKSRLQKLVEKTDDSGRVLSNVFMELPNKKQWPDYYKIIARPIAFEDIFKCLKRKEYHTSTDFAKDVETVFDNALQFNQDHSPIWEDAQQLRAYFSKLMSDLPEPFSLPQYASSGKIKLKRPAPPAAPESTTPNASVSVAPKAVAIASAVVPPQAQATSTSTPVVAPVPTPSLPYMPAQALPVAPATAIPASHQPNTAPSTTPRPVAPKVVAPKPAQKPQAPPVQPTISTPPTLAPAPRYQPPLPIIAAAASVSTSSSPAPSHTPTLPTAHPLESVLITVEPTKRRLLLHAADGVRSWVLRITPPEVTLRISDVCFLGGEEEGSEGDGESMEIDEPVPPPKRGRGRPPKTAPKPATPVKPNGAVVHAPKPSPVVHIRMNGTDISRGSVEEGWHVKPINTFNVVEIGSEGGVLWKVYVQTS